ncbi:YeeE/YedE family protein [Bradyrhizobium sp. WD16]|uniref:YeeE/YedE family protein n=1 Tax=Bradyrhizobium sp. WD16 TaxID=1521768 RepID=UPI0020A34EDC|nr:YeeE/YedE family protein [Bradyrhizobium sp. WD16]UTD28483.1 YeeE/YedE family protein [Bradyrhizobium sp. WD16]
MMQFTPFSAAIGGGLIGLSAVLLMISTGRIAGISGIVNGLLTARGQDRHWRLAFVGGLIIAPLLGRLMGYSFDVPVLPGSWAVLIVAGLLVGFGTRLAGGCTSGHGICGMARLSRRSITATGIFMAVAIVTVALSRHMF